MNEFLDFKKIFRCYEAFQPRLKYSASIEKKLPGKKVVVLAPHPDDEAIGCGGTLCLHARAGGSVSAVFCTSDGEPRDSESLAASRALGIGEQVFLGYRDGSLAEEKSLPERLIEVLDDRSPEIVFLPFMVDPHRDHAALNRAFLKAAAKRKYGFLVYAYPVWLPLYPNAIVDISDVWRLKKKAILSYASQVKTCNYVRMCEGASAYWCVARSLPFRHVEAFFRATAAEYVRLGKRILGA